MGQPQLNCANDEDDYIAHETAKISEEATDINGNVDIYSKASPGVLLCDSPPFQYFIERQNTAHNTQCNMTDALIDDSSTVVKDNVTSLSSSLVVDSNLDTNDHDPDDDSDFAYKSHDFLFTTNIFK